MSNDNADLICEVEATLLQLHSIAKIALDNHNYKSAGYDEPFIEHVDAGNLLWVITDLAESAYNKLQSFNIKNGGNNERV